MEQRVLIQTKISDSHKTRHKFIDSLQFYQAQSSALNSCSAALKENHFQVETLRPHTAEGKSTCGLSQTLQQWRKQLIKSEKSRSRRVRSGVVSLHRSRHHQVWTPLFKRWASLCGVLEQMIQMMDEVSSPAVKAWHHPAAELVSECVQCWRNMADVEFGPSLTDPNSQSGQHDLLESRRAARSCDFLWGSFSFDLKTRLKSNKEKPNKLLNITDFVSLILLSAETTWYKVNCTVFY